MAAVTAIAEHRPSLVILTSPNNPSGTALPLEQARQVARAALDVGAVLVIDDDNHLAGTNRGDGILDPRERPA